MGKQKRARTRRQVHLKHRGRGNRPGAKRRLMELTGTLALLRSMLELTARLRDARGQLWPTMHL